MPGKLKPDIVLLDLGLRSQDSLQLVKITIQHLPGTKIFVMDRVPFQSDFLEFMQDGVSGFILKDANVAEFIKTIRSVYKGEQVVPPHLTGSLYSRIVELAFKAVPQSTIIESVRMQNIKNK